MASSIQLLRSTNPQERPFAGNLLEGQPAANLHSSEPGLFFKTTDGSVVKFGPAAITSDGSPPNSTPQGSAGNSVGELWLDKSVDPAILKVYDGSQWVDAGSGSGGGSGSFLRWIYTAVGGETSLSGTSGGVLLNYTPGLEEVYVNGVLITRGTDYSAINGTSITNLAPLTAGDVVTVLSMNPLETVQLPGQVTLLRWTILAAAGQTVLSGIDSSSQQLAYTAGFEEVYINGAFLRRDIDYTATSGSSITISSPLAEDDEVTVMAWSAFQVGEQISANDVYFTQDGSSFTRTVSDKLRDTVSVEDFDAIGNGTADDTLKIQAAINSGLRVEFSAGKTYRITSTLNITNDFTALVGNGALIVGDYEQDPISPSATESMIYVNGADHVQIKDLRLQYTGTFSPGGPTVSYGGYISCIQVDDSDDFLADNVEAFGGNRSGINIAFGTVNPPYCNRPKILNCYLHHNRVGGITIGNTTDAIVRGCKLTFNGNAADGGTGYGFAAWASDEPINTLIDGNQANDNYRKGIDFHSGLNGVITNNVCARNRIYGIYVMGNRGAFTISNNLVTQMTGPNSFGLAIYGIRVGDLNGQTLTTPTSYVIDSNVINEFTVTSGSFAFPIAESMVGCKFGRLVITNNIIDVGTVGGIYNSANAVSGGVAGNYFDVTLSGNQIFAESCTSAAPPIYIRSPQNRQKVIEGNSINIGNVTAAAGIIVHDTTVIANRCFIATGNNIVAPTSGWPAGFDPIGIRRQNGDKMADNIINGATWRDWDGFKYVSRGTTAPSADFWVRGSQVWNTDATAGGFSGWVCTTGGTPGTWKTFGAISS